MIPAAPLSPSCRRRPSSPRRTAPVPRIWHTSSHFSCAPRKKELENWRLKLRIFAIVPHARKPGSCVSIMKSSTHSFRGRTGTSGSRRGNEGLSAFAGPRVRRVARGLALATLASFCMASARAMVGGASLPDASIARHVVLIVGGHSLCTGVAIAPDLVLTAAHCVLENGKYRLLKFEGRRAVSKEVTAVTPHPQFSPRSDAPDLALVKLAASPPPGLIPALFSDRRAPPTVGERFVVAGFGVAAQGERRTAGTLRAATLVVTDRPNSQL